MIAITGGYGFLGWHLGCRLRAHGAGDVRRLGRAEFADHALLRAQVSEATTIYHLAGVNRAGSEAEVEEGNVALANALAAAITAAGRPVRVAYANSVQARADNAYGRGKRTAAAILREALEQVGGSFVDVLLPNIFGEHGRPGYNSFVATFCHEVANGGTPQVSNDRAISLLHAQDAAQALIDAARGGEPEITPQGGEHRISDVLTLIRECHDTYARGDVPSLQDSFRRDLFNTYRSYVFPDRFPFSATVHADDRGDLFETVRSHGGTGQSFVSTTVPGATRGDHYHLRKIERFFVVRGSAEISLRRLLGKDVVRFRLDGSRPGFVDMPTMWVHNIKSVGSDDLVTMFWADQLLDLENPDQFPEHVEVDG